jgi:hypothetical protein
MSERELVIVGDVIKSRKKFNRSEWSQFHESIDKINLEFASFLKIPLTIYSGDSFGGICDSMHSAIKIILSLQEYQKKYKSRIVLIENHVYYGPDKKDFLTLEGPALWNSKPALENLKKGPLFFLAELKNEFETVTINTILNLILSIRNDWSEMEWEVYRHREMKLKQKDLADKLKVTQQYISKIKKSSKMQLIGLAELNLMNIVNELYDRNN